MRNTALPDDLLALVCSYTSTRLSFLISQVSRAWREVARLRKSLVLGVDSGSRFVDIEAALAGDIVDDKQILALARRCLTAGSLQHLDLSGCPCTSDEVLGSFAPYVDPAAIVDVSGCQRVTPAGLATLPTGISVKTQRCWRLQSPNPSQTASDVVEIQLLALGRSKGDEEAGIAKCFEYASPQNQFNTGPLENFSAMIRTGFPLLCRWESYTVNPLPTMGGWIGAMTAQDEDEVEDDECHASLQVTVRGWSRESQTFFWFLSKQTHPEHRGCWMTDSVLPAAAVQGDIG